MKRRKKAEREEKEECRCCCGALLARLQEDGLEIKCRRCKHFCQLKFSEPLLLAVLKFYASNKTNFLGKKVANLQLKVV